MKTFILIILLFCASFGMKAARVDTLLVESPSMKKRIEVIVISPDLAEQKPEWSLHKADGSIYRDSQGLAWVNPYKKEVWDR